MSHESKTAMEVKRRDRIKRHTLITLLDLSVSHFGSRAERYKLERARAWLESRVGA